MSFIIGDVVRLVSNGPPMVVVGVFDSGENEVVQVSWLGENLELQTASFPPACLKNAMTSPTLPDDVHHLRTKSVVDVARSSL